MAAIVLISSCNGHEEKSDLENFGLVGKVKSITSVSYEAYDKFGEGSLQKSNPNYAFIQVNEFDSIGNMLSEKVISIDKSKRWGTVVYNKKNQETKRVWYDDDSKVNMGTLSYYDENGYVIKEVDVMDNTVTNFKNEYDNGGRIISHIGGSVKNYWYYENGALVKAIEYFFDMKTELFYEDGLLVRDIRNPEIYWTHDYDAQRRGISSTMYENNSIKKKTKKIYSNDKAISPIETIEWDANGEITHDYRYSYFCVGNDTVTTFKFDNNELKRIEFCSHDGNGRSEDSYDTESSLITDRQYIYENGNLVSMRDLLKGSDYKYVDGILTIIEEKDGKKTEYKIKRNNLIGRIIKNESGETIYSYVVDGDNSKKTITIVDKGETKKGEEIYEDGKLVKFTEASNGLTSTVSYDKDGHLSEIKNSDGTVRTYKYEFDAQGNWVKEVTYKNGKPEKITERSILYYN